MMCKRFQPNLNFEMILKTTGLLLSVVITCLLTSCERPAATSTSLSALTSSENVRRVSLGLRPVGTNWFFYNAEFGEENWKLTPNGYGAKKIHRDSENNIQWEEDYYYSGRTFKTLPDNSTGWEMLTVHYDYTNSSLYLEYVGTDTAVEAIAASGTYAPIMSNKLVIADQILKRWGQSRR
jgi:hypothetical protein